MLDINFVASVAERDIDLLILEEMSVCDEFREWISTRIFGEPLYQTHLGAWHSVVDSQLGESDLIYLFAETDGRRNAILIENKVDALPQQNQGDRYRLRGDSGQKEGYWDRFKTCLVAPEQYLLAAKQSQDYDTTLSYEELFAYFQSRRTRTDRFAFKARMILEAIEKNRRGYQPQPCKEITQFVNEYYALASQRYRVLGMQESKPRPAGSTWVMFYPISFPKNVALAHQMLAGSVKAFFYGRASDYEGLKDMLSRSLPPGASVELAGKSVAITLKVPPLDPLKVPFSEQEKQVIAALEKLLLLERSVADMNP